MKHSFEVGKTAYIVEFRRKCEFIFYIDVINSKYKPYVMSDFELSFGDEPPLMIFTQTESQNIFAVKKHIDDFIGKAIKRYKPYFFFYASNEASKWFLYKKYGDRLAQNYGYDMHHDDDLKGFTLPVVQSKPICLHSVFR